MIKFINSPQKSVTKIKDFWEHYYMGELKVNIAKGYSIICSGNNDIVSLELKCKGYDIYQNQYILSSNGTIMENYRTIDKFVNFVYSVIILECMYDNLFIDSNGIKYYMLPDYLYEHFFSNYELLTNNESAVNVAIKYIEYRKVWEKFEIGELKSYCNEWIEAVNVASHSKEDACELRDMCDIIGKIMKYVEE